MSPARLPFLLLMALLAARAPALEWKTQHLAYRAAPLQKSAELSFDYRNAGTAPVTVTSVDTSCDCLAATVTAPTIAPGAAGAIQVRVALGDRFGSLQRSIVVSTDEGSAPTVLTIALEVPETATLSPRSLEWNLGAAATEQVVDVVVADGVTLVVTQVQSTSGAFAYRLETVEPGRHFRLHVTPRSTATGANAAFRLFSRANDAEDVLLNAYANVR